MVEEGYLSQRRQTVGLLLEPLAQVILGAHGVRSPPVQIGAARFPRGCRYKGLSVPGYPDTIEAESVGRGAAIRACCLNAVS